MNLRRLVNSKQFEAAVSAVIITNAVTLGAETYPNLADSHALAAINTICYLAFFIELALRIGSYGRQPQQFFRNGWNVFDFIVITATLIPGVAASAQALRLIRLARIVRLMRYLPDMTVLISSVARSVPKIASLFALATLLVFVYGMLGWNLFGTQLPDDWGTISRSMLTLTVLLTFEPLAGDAPTYIADATAVSPWGTAFFISYALIAAFIIFNLLIAIVIGSMEESREARKADQPAAGTAATLAQMRAALDALEAELNQPAAKQQQCAIMSKSAIRHQAETPNQ